MQIKGLRVPFIFLSMCLALGLLFGGNKLYQEYIILRPLVNELQGVPGVENVEINENGKDLFVTISLEEKAALNQTYNSIENTLGKRKNKNLHLQIKDRPSENLENLFYQVQFCIYEALAQGNFTDMSKNIEKILENAAEVKWKLDMDLHNIYLEMYDGDHYLYEIIPRQQQSQLMEVAS